MSWTSILKMDAKAWLANLEKEILDEMKIIFGLDTKLSYENNYTRTYSSKEYVVSVEHDYIIRDIESGNFGATDIGEPIILPESPSWLFGEQKEIPEEYRFNLPADQVFEYVLGVHGDPPHISISTVEENPRVQQWVNKKQKEIIEKFSQQKDRIHPDMYATEEEIAETEERHEGWKRELKE